MSVSTEQVGGWEQQTLPSQNVLEAFSGSSGYGNKLGIPHIYSYLDAIFLSLSLFLFDILVKLLKILTAVSEIAWHSPRAAFGSEFPHDKYLSKCH